MAAAADTISGLLPKEVTFDMQCTMPDDQTIMAHTQLINTVLVKLLDNAAKFTKQGSITLSLSQEDDRLHFAVTDTGCGIPADKSEYIFERFTKIDSFTQGTGLGLPAARLVAECLGGTLTLDTTYGDGAKFDFIIPINPQA